ncbi:hypothetical protein YTPLAS18_07230 [Nitrospira sp.]|nr:hypothetical protein YTPLAS18_07230 [Nitrospira sp.]
MANLCVMKGVGFMASHSALSFNLSEILTDGLEVDRDVMPSDLSLSGEDARLEGSVHVSATLHREDSCVLVTGLIDGTAVRQCVRCLRSFTEPLLVSFSAEYAKKTPSSARPKTGKTSDRSERSVEDETDVYEFVGEQVDLGPMLREQIILAEPMQPICRDDCQGLCPVCGQDRNATSCRCQESVEGTLAEKLRAAQRKQGKRRA